MALFSCLFSSTDKKLVVAIEGSVEEAKALYKPPEDSQGEQGGVAAARGIVFWVCDKNPGS